MTILLWVFDLIAITLIAMMCAEISRLNARIKILEDYRKARDAKAEKERLWLGR